MTSATPPIVALVGRPNVGKSTLFNRMIGARRAVVEDEPGTTRDRSYGTLEWNDSAFLVVDTAGLHARGLDEVAIAAEDQARIAVDQADLLVMVVDVTTSITDQDATVASVLRKSGKPVVLAVNKCDSNQRAELVSEFHRLGMGEPVPVSAYHGNGVFELIDRIVTEIPAYPREEDDDSRPPHLAIVGRPNAGKSSLFNRLLGAERSLISDVPGTTRDSIDTEMSYRGERVVLVDTAGLRRKGRVTQGVERHSVLRALASVRRCDVCLLVIDAAEGVTDQDAHIAGYALESMRGLAIVISKWDLMPKDSQSVARFEEELTYKFRFIGHAPIVKTSSVTGLNVGRVIPTGLQVFERTRVEIPTSVLNRYLLDRAARRTPPSRRGRITRLRYCTQTGTNPPTFRLFFSDPRDIPTAYVRYLENGLREQFGLHGAAVRMVVRGAKGR